MGLGQRARHLGEHGPAGKRPAQRVPLSGRKGGPGLGRQLGEHGRHHIPVAPGGMLALDAWLDHVVARQQLPAHRGAEQAAELGLDAGIPVNQRAVAIEGRPPRRHRPSVCTILPAAQAHPEPPGPVTHSGIGTAGSGRPRMARHAGPCLTQMRPGSHGWDDPASGGVRHCGPPDAGQETAFCREGALMADFFLRIDGIPGESQNPRHQGEIEVESFSWSETYLASAAGAGGGGGKVHVQDLHITKQIDKASPLLMLAVASGRHFTSAVLTAQRPGTEPLDYLTISLGGVMANSYQTGAPGRAGRTGRSGVFQLPPDCDRLPFAAARRLSRYAGNRRLGRHREPQDRRGEPRHIAACAAGGMHRPVAVARRPHRGQHSHARVTAVAGRSARALNRGSRDPRGDEVRRLGAAAGAGTGR